MPTPTLNARVTSAAFALALLAGSVAAMAHHGWEGYRTEDFELAGTVEVPVSLAGPHASLKIRADGQLWNVVLAPPPRTARAGLTEGIIPAGATVTAYGHRHKDPKTLEVKTERLRWNDRLFNVYPERP
jgi:hypothetical protein